MTNVKKNLYDHTSTERSARRDQRMIEQGGQRLSGWLDKDRAEKLQQLIRNGYAENMTAAISKAIDEAHHAAN